MKLIIFILILFSVSQRSNPVAICFLLLYTSIVPPLEIPNICELIINWILLFLASVIDFQRNLTSMLSYNLLNLEAFPKYMFIVLYFELFQEKNLLIHIRTSWLSPLQFILVSLLSYIPSLWLQSSHFSAGTMLMAPYWMPNKVQIYQYMYEVMSSIAIP